MKIVKSIVAFLGVIILISLDQFVKYLIDTRMTLGQSHKLIDGVFAITYVQNKGAAWGSFSGKTTFLLVLTVLIVIAAIVFYIRLFAARERQLKLQDETKDTFKILRICLIFIVSGAIGNIIDRFSRGYVIDMFDFNLINFPVFNVADIYVTCSVILVMILIIFVYKDDDFAILKKTTKEDEKPEK